MESKEQVRAKVLSQVSTDIPSSPAVKKVPNPAVASLTILHVDDESVLTELTRDSLPSSKYKVLEARSVDQAIRILQKHSTISLILCDISMPGQSGFALLDYLKKNSNFRNIPVLVCSGFIKEDIVRKAEALGVSGFLAKPYSPKALLEKIESTLAFQRVTIVIVSSDRIVSNILKQLFERKFCQTLTVESKFEAMQTISANKTDAVISELVLNDGTGPELLAQLRESDAQMPIFFLDDQSIKISETKVIGLGANGVIRRPLNGNQIYQRITASILNK